jgi:hypothetical protein
MMSSETSATADGAVPGRPFFFAASRRRHSEQDKTLPWEERKAHYLAHFVEKRWEAQAGLAFFGGRDAIAC